MLTDRSKKNLVNVHPDLIRLCEAVDKRGVKFNVICGHRGEADQNKAFNEKRSKVKFPDSKHNKSPSLAIDITPIPLDWDKIEAFSILGRIFKEVAIELGIKISWGGDWTKFRDYPHIELG
jgi:peptidoglycan LD-endopeptidase CwlK